MKIPQRKNTRIIKLYPTEEIDFKNYRPSGPHYSPPSVDRSVFPQSIFPADSMAHRTPQYIEASNVSHIHVDNIYKAA